MGFYSHGTRTLFPQIPQYLYQKSKDPLAMCHWPYPYIPGQGGRPVQPRCSLAGPEQGFPGGWWEGAGAEHVRLRVSLGSWAPPRQDPEQGLQGPQAAQAPCAVVGVEEWTVVKHAQVFSLWQFSALTQQIHSGFPFYVLDCPYSLGQSFWVSQACDCWASPGQWPPHLGAGWSHTRWRVWVPLEQVTEQGPQGAHSDQPPISVGEKEMGGGGGT